MRVLTQLSLGQKVLLLLAFMGITAVCISLWFMSQLFYRVSVFESSMVRQEKAIKADREKSLKQIKEKAEKMKGDINDHFNSMEAALLKIQKDEKVFQEDFMERQNQHFDEVDNFVLHKERAP